MRWVRPAVVVLVTLAVAATLWIGVRGWLAKGHLEKAVALVPRLEQQARHGNAGTGDVTALQRETRAARDLTGDPVWSGAQQLPWVGVNLSAMRTTARAVDTVATRAVPPLLSVANTLDLKTLHPRRSGIDLQALQEVQAPVHQADQTLKQAQVMLSPYVGQGVHASSLVQPLRHAIARLVDRLDTLADLTGAAARAADLLQVSASRSSPIA
jgi:hypothetical protein